MALRVNGVQRHPASRQPLRKRGVALGPGAVGGSSATTIFGGLVRAEAQEVIHPIPEI